MKVTITATPDEAKSMLRIDDYKFILTDFLGWLRQEIKYNNKSEYEPVKDYIYSLIRDNEISSDLES